MRTPNWLKKLGFWIIHFCGWILLNVVLGSLPFVAVLFRGGTDNPFLVGLLCFCFTAASSGIYSLMASSSKDDMSGIEKGMSFLLLAVAVVWMVIVWTIVLILPEILSWFGEGNIMIPSAIFYLASIVLFFIANLKQLSSLVNDHVAKYLILDPAINSKADGSVMKNSLKNEGTF